MKNYQVLLEKFQQKLKSKKLSKVSIKNYVSDIRHFFQWTAKNNFLHLNANLFNTYKSHLISQKTPTKSINRYLTSLRQLGKFLKQEKITMFNPSQSIKNEFKNPDYLVSKSRFSIKSGLLLEKFKKELLKEKLKPATIKNYLTDIKQFLNWQKLKNEIS